MPVALREAEIIWEGPLARGTGTLTSGSGALDQLTVTWASRTERPDGKTSPEELIAAAHASCFAMAVALVLGENKTPPERDGRERRLHARRGGGRAANNDRRAQHPRTGARARGGRSRGHRRAGGRSLPGLQRAAWQRHDQRAQRARPSVEITPGPGKARLRPADRRRAPHPTGGGGRGRRSRPSRIRGAHSRTTAGGLRGDSLVRYGRQASHRTAVSSGRIRQLGDDLYEIEPRADEPAAA